MLAQHLGDAGYLMRLKPLVHPAEDVWRSALEAEGYFDAAGLGHRSYKVFLHVARVENAPPDEVLA